MEDQDTQIPLSKKKSLAKKLFFFVFAVLFFAVAGVAAYSSYELYKIKSQNYQQQAIEKQAKEEGMITLKQDVYLKVAEGTTTVEEILRVAQE